MDAKKAAGYFTPERSPRTTSSRRPRAGARRVSPDAQRVPPRSRARLRPHSLAHDCRRSASGRDAMLTHAGRRASRRWFARRRRQRPARRPCRRRSPSRGSASRIRRRSLPFALAAFRGRRPRPLGGAAPSASTDCRRTRSRAAASISRSCRVLLDAGAGAGLVATASPAPARPMRAPRGWASRASTCSPTAPSAAIPRAIRCASMPSGWPR